MHFVLYAAFEFLVYINVFKSVDSRLLCVLLRNLQFVYSCCFGLLIVPDVTIECLVFSIFINLAFIFSVTFRLNSSCVSSYWFCQCIGFWLHSFTFCLRSEEALKIERELYSFSYSCGNYLVLIMSVAFDSLNRLISSVYIRWTGIKIFKPRVRIPDIICFWLSIPSPLILFYFSYVCRFRLTQHLGLFLLLSPAQKTH